LVFKRRDRRSWLRTALDFLWPKGGWSRAFQYVKHRLRRLPGTPEYIGRGIWAGVFTTFTPFYGLHFVVAAALAWILRGNIFAALMATFFGNPLTYLPIGVIALETGYFLLGAQYESASTDGFLAKFWNAADDFWSNLWALFSGAPADWSGLVAFYHDIFFPYMIGGIAPGVITATIGYYLSVPLIRAYQKRRGAKLRKKKLGRKISSLEIPK